MKPPPSLAAALAALLATVLAILPAAAGRPPDPAGGPPAPAFDRTLHAADAHPCQSWEFTVESGYLWKVGAATAYDYEIAPTQLTLRTPSHWTWWEGDSGARLVVRGRMSLLLEAIVEGPEDYYFGFSAAPSVEYWFPSRRSSLFLSVGGGAGLTNSTGEPGAQGQDLTFNWFTQLGVRHALSGECSLLTGVYFLHHSNLSMTDPNPGLDTFGVTAGVGWRF